MDYPFSDDLLGAPGGAVGDGQEGQQQQQFFELPLSDFSFPSDLEDETPEPLSTVTPGTGETQRLQELHGLPPPGLPPPTLLDPVMEEEPDESGNNVDQTTSLTTAEPEQEPLVIPQYTLQEALHRSTEALDGTGTPSTRRPGPQRTELQRHDEEGDGRSSRSRSPLREFSNEQGRAFAAFLARRTSNKKSVAARQKELHYHKCDEKRQHGIKSARRKEWENWTNFQAVDVLNPLKSQPWEADRHKARLVVRGDLERDGMARTDSPTCSQTMLSLVLSLAAAKGWRVKAGDITAAFLQGEVLTRTLVLRPSKDGIEGVEDGSLMIAHRPVYGTKDAPRGFFRKLHRTAIEIGLRPVPHEAACYVLNDDNQNIRGMVVSHVDDLLWTGDDEMQNKMRELQDVLKFGSLDTEDSFSYCARIISQTADGIRVTCPNTAAKVRPILVKGARRSQRDSPATDVEINQLRSVLASLNWVARVCRPDICYVLSNLQTVQRKALVQDLLDCNKVLKHVQDTPDIGIFYKYYAYEFEKAIIVHFTDASHAADFDTSQSGEKLGNRSQSGRMLCLASPQFLETGEGHLHLIEYHSNVVKRVCRSTLQAETLSMVQGYEESEHLRAVLHGLEQEHQNSHWVTASMDARTVVQLTDCRSLDDHLRQGGLSSTGDKRLAIDLSAMRQVVWRQPGELHGDPLYHEEVPQNASTKVVWIETSTMLADALTKKMKSSQLDNFLKTGFASIDMDKTYSKKGEQKSKASGLHISSSMVQVC